MYDSRDISASSPDDERNETMKSGITVGIETSGMTASVCLMQQLELVESVDLSPLANQRSRMLVPILDELMRKHQLTFKDLGLIAVSLGPGSFTGLRLGIVVAKTLAYAHKIPLIGVSTFQVLADQVGSTNTPIDVISDAQRGDVFWQSFVMNTDGTKAQADIRIIRWEAYLQEVTQPHTPASPRTITGPALTRYANQLPTSITATDKTLWQPTAIQVATTGYHVLQQHGPTPPATLAPLYIRASSAEEKRLANSG
jgi:tRNA threonylcarbamoyladenosine biosynthesis protein TsaB